MADTTWRERSRARKIQRLRDEHNDYFHWLWYARLGMSPSRVRKAEDRLERLTERIDALLDETEYDKQKEADRG